MDGNVIRVFSRLRSIGADSTSQNVTDTLWFVKFYNSENIVANGEIALNEQFLHLPQCFQPYSIITLSLINFIYIFVLMFSKSAAADLLYVGKV